ncbi:DUF4974 domain-containing protein [Sphingobacterium kitahiroshimense]|uniref:FecR family protein n=1 Tax=Sphingobacterium sp. B16(2022) TaxID=2914044 RepID=UPI001438C469|nr:FecR domain-containing protein [Sphingobacterium sp. B16(2022)]NJI71999.1 DUF4974 domain-containing protein [Sphingobacterium sp. B16(2022)]
MSEKELNQLFAKFLRKECTEQELDLLFRYFADDQYEGEVKKLIESNWSHDLSDDLDFQFKMRQSFLKTDAYLNKRINGAEEKGFFKKNIRWISYAAACMLLASSVPMYKFFLKAHGVSSVASSSLEKKSIQSKLLFANGDVVYLDSIAHGPKLLYENQEARIEQLAVDKIQVFTKKETEEKGIEWVSLDVPKGKHMEVLLADGSIALINSMSQFKFPMIFSDDNRGTELVGEGYFEVAHNKEKRFLVKTPNQLIQVFGTKFNVRNYLDEEAVSTALFEGKVSVKVLEGDRIGSERMLRPGEQLDIEKNHMQIKQQAIVDHDEILGWTTGKFIYNNTPLKIMLKDLTRWYNVEVDWDTVPDLRFQGTIPQELTIEEVVEVLNEVGGLKIKLINNQLTFKI